MAVAFGDFFLRIQAQSQALVGQHTGVGTEPHGPAFLNDLPLLIHERNNRSGRGVIDFGRIRFFKATHMPGEFDHRHLHAKTNP